MVYKYIKISSQIQGVCYVKSTAQHRKMAMASWPGPASLGQLMPTVPGRRKQLKPKQPKQPKPLALMAHSPGTRQMFLHF